MVALTLETRIAAPIEVCFDLARSIDLHVESSRDTGEQAIAGKTSGLIGDNETVTWRAKHGWWQELTTKITQFDRPKQFRDSIVKGWFKRFDHDHIFVECQGFTLMIDKIEFASHGWLLGTIIDMAYVERHMTDYLKRRNTHIKMIAEDPRLREPFLSARPGL